VDKRSFYVSPWTGTKQMPSTVTLGRLFKALAMADIPDAMQVARQIVEAEHRSGHRSAAALLRGALNPNGNGVMSVASAVGPALDPNAVLIAERPGPPLTDVVLTNAARGELEEVISEWHHRHALGKQGLTRRTKALFFGPPGCGKTLAARAVGTEMRLPVLTVRFSSVVGAYLGQTGAHLRGVFKFAEGNPCILFLDEFDAVSRSRGRSEDVGELDRIVISLLQELDHTVPAGMVIAATNLPESLDRAIWRRFDVLIKFPAPTRRQIVSFAQEKDASVHALNSARNRIPRTLHSFADVDGWLNDRQRRRFLRGLMKTYAKTR
jgi:hypothetical protein